MTLLVAAGKAIKAGGPQQVYPVDYEAEASLRLLDAALRCDLRAASECLRDPHVDVNYSGAVLLCYRRAEVLLRDGGPDEVAFHHEELRTDVTPLFLAAHGGSLDLVRKLLNICPFLPTNEDPAPGPPTGPAHFAEHDWRYRCFVESAVDRARFWHRYPYPY